MSKPISHGTHSGYSRGCRCEGCAQAHRVYNRDRKRQFSRFKQGIGPAPESRFVDPDTSRAHLQFLQRRGVSINAVAEKSGLSEFTLKKIRSGRSKMVAKTTEAAILAVGASDLGPRQLVSSKYSQQIFEALKDAGLTINKIHMLLGYGNHYWPLIRGKWIRVENQDRWEKLYFDVFRHPAPFEKSNVTKMASDGKAKK